MESISHDVIHYAAQIGRLDFVSALLATVAILLALAAIPFYLVVRAHAERIAKEEANQVAEEALENIEQIAVNKIESMLPKMLEEYRDIVVTAVSADIADNIAKAQENGDEK